MDFIGTSIEVAVKHCKVEKSISGNKKIRVQLLIRCFVQNAIKAFRIIDRTTDKVLHEIILPEYKWSVCLTEPSVYEPEEIRFDNYDGKSKNIYVETEYFFDVNSTTGNRIVTSETINIEGK